MRRLATWLAVGFVAALGVAAGIAALVTRGDGEASSPVGTTHAQTSVVSSTTAPSTSESSGTSTAAESGTEQTATEPVTVTGLADVPTTPELGTDVMPKSAPPWHKELAVCTTHSFRVVYDRETPAILVLRGDQVLAWAGLYRRDVTDECRNLPRKPPLLSSEIPKGIYESVELRCNAPASIQVDVRPIELHGSVNGSIIVVSFVGTKHWLVSAIVVNEVEGRRVYIDEKYCTRA
jgi:hypothetical protein